MIDAITVWGKMTQIEIEIFYSLQIEITFRF